MHTLFLGFRFLFTRKKLCFLQQRITHPNAPNLNSILFLQHIFNTQSSIQGAKDVTNPFILEDAALGTAVPLTTNLPFMSGSPSLSNQNSSSSMNFLKTIYNYCFEYNIAVTTRRLLFTSYLQALTSGLGSFLPAVSSLQTQSGNQFIQNLWREAQNYRRINCCLKIPLCLCEC